MYKLDYLPVARRDMVGIAHYIGITLQNRIAAERLAVALVDAIDRLPDFPYACLAYIPLKPLRHEYRRLLVDNYSVFYWVDEKEKRITVARVIYSKRQIDRLLD